jgi:hypothetical protein
MCYWFGLEILRLVYKKAFSKREIFFAEKLALRNFSKKCFSEKKSLGTSLRQRSTHFLN